jgi:hypothetical protein
MPRSGELANSSHFCLIIAMYWDATPDLSRAMKSRISFKSLVVSAVNLAVAIIVMMP